MDSSSLQDQDLKILYHIIKGQKSIKIINIDIRRLEISNMNEFVDSW